ncbi:ATP-binding protein [Nonomuraea gerenzanensis]|uniref:histidine kinase n=1 Tax=Nonomuraea gerenzanensis TaxID=93944 RepID=A0A1M4EMA0_9ACTN|nr:ATP-binding protein [Nonomuraea gerenzanensis]UBU11461.1 response regulator [Nonomuraea gerenzanensis]SBO99945.1 Putative SigmaB asociated two-component system sensor protein [Nonomuraea gerenzanensis]
MRAAPLATIRVRDDHDVFAMRRMGREVAAAAGMSEQDQIRVATALSEVGRELVIDGGADVRVDFLLDADDLVISLTLPLTLPLALPLTLPSGGHDRAEGVTMAARLMDAVETDRPGELLLRKRIGATRSRSAEQIRAAVEELPPGSALDELRQQNRELASTLEAVRLLYAELAEKSRQLQQTGETKDRFWATVSHELRTPLHSIIGLVGLLTGPCASPLNAEQGHQVQLIGSSARTLLDLVSELLDLAKAESGRLEPQPAEVDVVALAEWLRLTLTPTSGDARVELTVHVAQPPPAVWADEAMLTRILRNLLANGLKFTEDGEVRLAIADDPATSETVFTVTDTGIGIPAEHLDLVFENFHQVPGPAQVRGRGTGLGLPYARELAEAMGGTLTLTSTPGRGVTATLRLPHSSHDVPMVRRVLVADDDPAFRARVRRMLTGFAAHVDEAPDGTAALAVMRSAPPDLALLDLLMPGLDGVALLRLMTEDERLRAIPVIVMAVSPVDGHAFEADVTLGKHDLRRDVLLDAIRQAMKRHR